jgi:hypothetical protein
MSSTPKILAFAGSTRKESFNKKLVRIAAQGARATGAEVSVIDLRDLPLPLFDEDLEREKGLPENARKLKDLFLAHHGLLIASPEYNSSYSAVLKNTIDWVSRPVQGEAPLGCFVEKVAGRVGRSARALPVAPIAEQHPCAGAAGPDRHRTGARSLQHRRLVARCGKTEDRRRHRRTGSADGGETAWRVNGTHNAE